MEAIRIVLTGGGGFVGSALLRQSAIDADTMIRALIRRPLPQGYAFVEEVKGDLFDIPARLWFDTPYVLVHYATKQMDRDGNGFMHNNVRGTEHLLASIQGPCLGIIYGSSMSVYGDGAQRQVLPDHPLRPATSLAVSRVAAEQLIKSAMQQSERWSIALRPRFIIGNGDRYTMKVMMQLAERGIRINSGEQRFSIIDVDDYARIILSLVRLIYSHASTPRQLAFHAAYPQGISYNEWMSAIAGITGVSWPRTTWPLPAGLIRLLRWLPWDGARQLATKAGLLGLDHTGDVNDVYVLTGQLPLITPIMAVQAACTAFIRQ